MIVEGCIILVKKMERCIVGIWFRIGEGMEIFNVIVMGNDWYEFLDEIEVNVICKWLNFGIGNNCYIRNVIIDKDVCMGNNVSIYGSVVF